MGSHYDAALPDLKDRASAAQRASMSAFTADPYATTTEADDIDTTEQDDLQEDAEHDETDTSTDGATTGPDTTEDSAEGSTPKAKPARQSQRPLIRRAVKKTLEVLDADPQVLKLTAAILGHNAEDTEQVVVAILTSDRRTLLQPVTDLRDIRSADQLEMGIHATALGRERLRDLWTLLDRIGRADGALPSSDPKAALKVVKAVVGVDDDDMTLIDLADELLKKV